MVAAAEAAAAVAASKLGAAGEVLVVTVVEGKAVEVEVGLAMVTTAALSLALI